MKIEVILVYLLVVYSVVTIACIYAMFLKEYNKVKEKSDGKENKNK